MFGKLSYAKLQEKIEALEKDAYRVPAGGEYPAGER